MSNWFSRLFGSKPLTPAELDERAARLEEEINQAIRDENPRRQLQCAEQLLKLRPDDSFATMMKLMALEKLSGR